MGRYVRHIFQAGNGTHCLHSTGQTYSWVQGNHREAERYRGASRHQWVPVVSVTLLKAIARFTKISLNNPFFKNSEYIQNSWLASLSILKEKYPSSETGWYSARGKAHDKEITEDQGRKQINISILVFTVRAVTPYTFLKTISLNSVHFLWHCTIARKKWGALVAYLLHLGNQGYFYLILDQVPTSKYLKSLLHLSPSQCPSLYYRRQGAYYFLACVTIFIFQRKHSLVESSLACRHSQHCSIPHWIIRHEIILWGKVFQGGKATQ